MSDAASSPPSSPALHQQLRHVAQALQLVRAGQSATTVLEQEPPPLRPGVQALLFHVLRFLGRAQALRQQLAPKPPAPKVDALLCTALALLWDRAQAPYTAFTLVNQTVQAARTSGLERQAGFINACLRRFLREQDALVAATDADLTARFNHPRWWIEKLQQQYPAQWQSVLHASNQHAPLVLRVNTQRTTQAAYLALLAEKGLPAQAVGDYGVVLAQALPVQALPGFADGLVSVQDGAAQWAAPLLLAGWDVPAGARILDACAAPGGKTAHLLELLPPGQADVVALEVDAQRSQRIHDTLQRLGLAAQVVVADAGAPASWPHGWGQGAQWDGILLDAPCSASGIVRRHPEVRWLRRPGDIAQLARQQARLLAALWPVLKPGGRLLYCTCSIFREEGQAQIDAFVARNKTAQCLPAPGHLLPGVAAVQDNRGGDHDGFFYALLSKTA